MTAGIDCNYGPAVIDRRYSKSNCTTSKLRLPLTMIGHRWSPSRCHFAWYARTSGPYSLRSRRLRVRGMVPIMTARRLFARTSQKTVLQVKSREVRIELAYPEDFG